MGSWRESVRPSEGSRRLFLALWPGDSIRRSMSKVAETWAQPGWRLVDESNLHLTLVFLGATSESDRQKTETVCEGLATASSGFDIQVSGGGCWLKPKVAWLGLIEIPLALTLLQRDLNKALSDIGFQPEERTYRPHITVARKVRETSPSPEYRPIKWRAEGIALVESESTLEGVRYQVLSHYLFDNV